VIQVPAVKEGDDGSRVEEDVSAGHGKPG
jgi:hypothetical protein